MKNKIKIILAFIIGGLIFGSIGVYAATIILAKDVNYTNTKSKLDSTNVQDAIDEVYEKITTDKKYPYGEYPIMGNRWGNKTTFDFYNAGVIIQPNQPMYPSEKIDFTGWKYLIIEIWYYQAYAENWYFGYTSESNPTMSQCISDAKEAYTHQASGSDKKYKLITIDISNVNGEYTPYAALSSSMYTFIKYMYLSNSLPS